MAQTNLRPAFHSQQEFASFVGKIEGKLHTWTHEMQYSAAAGFFVLSGSLTRDDGNINDDATKQWSDWLNKRAARAARTLVQLFDVVCQMTTWNFQIQGLNDKANTQQQIFHSLYLFSSDVFVAVAVVAV